MARDRKVRGTGKAARKVVAFRYKMSDTSTVAYRDRLRTLRDKYGIEFGFAANAKLTGPRKAAISRKAAKLVEFLNPENNFRFVPLTPEKRKAVKKNRDISPAQLTKKGAFIPAPRGKKTKVRISKKGVVETQSGNETSHHHIFDSADVVANPQLVLDFGEKLGAERIFITIKGHRGGSRKNGYSLKNFMRYLEKDILPDIEGEEDETEEALASIGLGKKRKGAFRNFVGIEYITHNWNTYEKQDRKNKRRKKGKRGK